MIQRWLFGVVAFSGSFITRRVLPVTVQVDMVCGNFSISCSESATLHVSSFASGNQVQVTFICLIRILKYLLVTCPHFVTSAAGLQQQKYSIVSSSLCFNFSVISLNFPLFVKFRAQSIMGNHGSTLLRKGDKYDGNLALKMSRLAFHQQLLARAKSKTETSPSFSSEAHKDEQESKSSVDPADYDFEFENLVLEGGGAKGIAYCGAIKYLENIGVMKKITRLAGASAGALVALMLAVGYNSDEMTTFTRNLDDILFGGDVCPFGNWNPINIVHHVVELLKHYGVHTGQKLYKHLGDKIKEKGLDPDITFLELLDEKKITLCIVVTNLNEKSTEYCHPKTTPHMPIRIAARMSMSFPGVFTPINHLLYKDQDWFLDGGLLSNYPINCFDGWFLSMEEEDAFLNRIQSLTDIPNMMDYPHRFQPVNNKTMGIMVHSDSDDDVLKWQLDDRPGCKIPEKPTPLTRIYKKWAKNHTVVGELKELCNNIKKAADDFIKAVKDKHNPENDTISLEELEEIFNDENVFPKEDAELLFGKDITPQQAFKILDKNKHGKIRFSDLMFFLYESGIMLQKYFYGNERSEITGLKSYGETMISSVMLGTRKAVIHERDLVRTVGINTRHVGVLDFKLEDEDYDFLIARGYNGTRAFFDMYIPKNPDKVHTKVKIT